MQDRTIHLIEFFAFMVGLGIPVLIVHLWQDAKRKLGRAFDWAEIDRGARR